MYLNRQGGMASLPPPPPVGGIEPGVGVVLGVPKGAATESIVAPLRFRHYPNKSSSALATPPYGSLGQRHLMGTFYAPDFSVPRDSNKC